jgi:predicted nucleic acid-binding protein
MILVDTSVWIDHFRSHDQQLADFLEDAQVLVHPFVIGELALGSLRNRRRVIEDLLSMPQAVVASEAEVLTFIETASLAGTGIGYIDAHLLVSTKLTGASLWTHDKRAAAMGKKLNVSFDAG